MGKVSLLPLFHWSHHCLQNLCILYLIQGLLLRSCPRRSSCRHALCTSKQNNLYVWQKLTFPRGCRKRKPIVRVYLRIVRFFEVITAWDKQKRYDNTLILATAFTPVSSLICYFICVTENVDKKNATDVFKATWGRKATPCRTIIRNISVKWHSRAFANHCCRGRAISITYFCVYACLWISGSFGVWMHVRACSLAYPACNV